MGFFRRPAAVAAALALCMAMVFCGCGSKQAFVYYLDASPQNLDPQLASSPQDRTAVSALFTPLVYDQGGVPAPAAAESWTVSDDGLIYTFTLQAGRVFTDSDGETWPVTAADFAYGLSRVFLPQTQSPYAEALGSIAGSARVLAGENPSVLGVVALNDTTLRITLSKPDSDFLCALDCPGAMPCREEFFLACKGGYGLSADAVLGNGLFTVRSWSDDAGITLLPVESYTGMVSRVRLPVEDGSATPYSRLLKEEADAALLTADETPQGDVVIYNTTTWALVLNPASGALASENVRLAFCALGGLAADAALPAGFTRATGLVPPSVAAGNTAYRDRAGAVLYESADPLSLYRQGLSALGLPRAGALTLLLPDDDASLAYGDSLNALLQKELSVFCNIKTAPLADVQAAARAGAYDIVLLPLQADDEDVRLSLPGYGPQVGNTWAWGDVSAALAALSDADGGQVSAAALAAERAIVYGGLVCPVFFEPSRFAVADWVTGLEFSPFGPTLNLRRIGLGQE